MEKELKDVHLKKGQCILFSRQLLHSGTAYKETHRRFFAYIEIFPKGKESFTVIPRGTETSLYNFSESNVVHSRDERKSQKWELNNPGGIPDIEARRGVWNL